MIKPDEILHMQMLLGKAPAYEKLPVDKGCLRDLCRLALVGLYVIEKRSIKGLDMCPLKMVDDPDRGPVNDIIPQNEFALSVCKQAREYYANK